MNEAYEAAIQRIMSDIGIDRMQAVRMIQARELLRKGRV